MAKNIALFLDGTWNDDPDSRTNVLLLHDECVNDGAQQLTAYFKGVGTEGWHAKKLGDYQPAALQRHPTERANLAPCEVDISDRPDAAG